MTEETNAFELPNITVAFLALESKHEQHLVTSVFVDSKLQKKSLGPPIFCGEVEDAENLAQELNEVVDKYHDKAHERWLI